MHSYDSLQPQSYPFSYQGKHYVLLQASAGAAKRYREVSIAGAKMTVNDDDGTRSVERMSAVASLEPLLVSLCAFRADTNGLPEKDKNGRFIPVPLKEIEGTAPDYQDGWPASIVKDLFERAKEMGGLDEKEDLKGLYKQRDRLNKKIAKLEHEEQALKNSQQSTGDSSN